MAVYFEYLELRHKVELHNLTGVTSAAYRRGDKALAVEVVEDRLLVVAVLGETFDFFTLDRLRTLIDRGALGDIFYVRAVRAGLR